MVGSLTLLSTTLNLWGRAVLGKEQSEQALLFIGAFRAG
jgi:hypothetical protein